MPTALLWASWSASLPDRAAVPGPLPSPGWVVGEHRAWCGRRNGNVQREYRVSSAFPVKWLFLEQRPLPSGGNISLVYRVAAAAARHLLWVQGATMLGISLPSSQAKSHYTWKHLPRGTWQCWMVIELYIKTWSHASLLVPHAGQGEESRHDVGLLLPAAAGTSGCFWPGPCGWEASLSSGVGSQVVTHLGSSSLPFRILLALALLSIRFFRANQSVCAWHLALRQPPLQLRQVLTKQMSLKKQHGCFAPKLSLDWDATFVQTSHQWTCEFSQCRQKF